MPCLIIVLLTLGIHAGAIKTWVLKISKINNETTGHVLIQDFTY